MTKEQVVAQPVDAPPRRGRPVDPNAKSGAERQAKYRQKMRASGLSDLSVMVTDEVAQALAKHVEFKDVPLGTVVDRILRGYLLRKR
jgi:hypothetical protein